MYSEESGRDDAKLLAAAQIEELSEKDLAKRMAQLERQMLEHARNLEFEQAARLRDQLAQLREQAFGARVQDSIVPLDNARKAGATR